MTRQIHRQIKIARAIDPQSLGATAGGGISSKIIDRMQGPGFEALEFAVAIGAVTATNATVTASVLEGDATGSLTAAGATSTLGPLTLIGQTTPRVSNVSKLVTKKIGYIGFRRYAQLKLVPTVSGAIQAAAVAILGDPREMPVASQ